MFNLFGEKRDLEAVIFFREIFEEFDAKIAVVD